MNLYAAMSVEDGIQFDHEFMAKSFKEAKKIATSKGWQLLGPIVYQLEMEPEEMERLIESMKAETLH